LHRQAFAAEDLLHVREVTPRDLEPMLETLLEALLGVYAAAGLAEPSACAHVLKHLPDRPLSTLEVVGRHAAFGQVGERRVDLIHLLPLPRVPHPAPRP